MNTPDLLIGALGWAIVHSIWQAALIALAVKLALAVFREGSAAFKYNIALGGLATLVLVFGFTFLVMTDSLSDGTKGATGDLPAFATETIPDQMVTTHASKSAEGYFQDFFKEAGRTIDASTRYILAAWFAGFLSFALRFLGSYLHIHRMKTRHSFLLPAKWQSMLKDIQSRLNMKKGARLMESAATAVPIVIGHIRPVIILPVGLVTHIPFNQLEAILVHELAHIRRYDYLVNLAVSLLKWIFFYHPSFWWLNRKLELYREHCCDDITISYCGRPDPLRSALLDLSSLNQKSPHIAAAFYKNDHQLLNRIKRMKTKNQKNHETRISPAPILAVLAIIAVALAGSALAPRTGEQWQSMSLIPAPEQVKETISTVPAVLGTAQVPDTTAEQKKTSAVKKINDDGIVSLELDEDGNLLGVKKDGRELTGEEREKYEKLILKVQELKEKEKAIEKNREELEKVRERLRETELKMKEVQKEYQHAMQEYIQRHAETNWRAYDSAWGLYGEQYARAEELEKMFDRQQDLAGMYRERFFDDQEHWKDMQDDLLRDRMADQEQWTLYRDLIEDQHRISREEMEEAMKEMKQQQEMEADFMLREAEIRSRMEDLKAIEMEARLFEQVVRQELVRDGLLERPSDELSFHLSEKRLVVNGEKQNAGLREKYLKLYRKYAHDDILGDKKVSIED